MNDSQEPRATVNPYAAPAIEKHRAGPDECPICFSEQRRFSMLSQYYRCPACERELVLRLPPVTREIFYLGSAVGSATMVLLGGTRWVIVASILFGIGDAVVRIHFGEILAKPKVQHSKRNIWAIALTITAFVAIAFLAFTSALFGEAWLLLAFIAGSCCVAFFGLILLFGKRHEAGYLELPPGMRTIRNGIGTILAGILAGILAAVIFSL